MNPEGSRRRVLLVINRHDYGDPTRGDSYEYVNFHSTLEQMGFEVAMVDFPQFVRTGGTAGLDRALREAIADFDPDLAFFVIHTEDFEPTTLRALRGADRPLTLNWFTDDHWRFRTFSARWAPLFDFVATTAPGLVERYQALGARAIKTQWAVNPMLYPPSSGEVHFDVSFVGQPHGDRAATIEWLQRRGIDVECWGYGWPRGRLEFTDMVDVFGSSLINLNLTGSSVGPLRARGWEFRGVYRLDALLRKVWPPPAQLKARIFEIPACRGLALTAPAPELELYYEVGREIDVFRNRRELLERIRHYLSHPDEARSIAEAGYARTLRDHTYEMRFAQLFAAMGLS